MRADIMVVCFIFRRHLSGERRAHLAAVIEAFADRVVLVFLLQQSMPNRLELLGLLRALRAANCRRAAVLRLGEGPGAAD